MIIIDMDANIAFLIQAVRIVQNLDSEPDDIEAVFQFVTNLDNELIISYNKTCNVLAYGSDLDLYLDLLEYLRNHYERKEEYEKCITIKKKIDFSQEIKRPVKRLTYE